MPLLPDVETRFCADCSTETPVKYMASAADNRGLLCRRCRQRNANTAKTKAQHTLFGDQSSIFDLDGRAEFDAIYK